MIPKKFKHYFINSNEAIQQHIVSILLDFALSEAATKDLATSKASGCPHCQSKAVVANGKLKNVQRFLCNTCGKHFSETTGKFWSYLKKKDKIAGYLYCLLSGYSIRKSAREVGIALRTSFDWRHKLFSAFSGGFPENFHKIIDGEELSHLHSGKGSRCSRKQKMVDEIYRLQNTDDVDVNLQEFIESSNDTTAKYLKSYVNWCSMLKEIKHSTEKMAVE